METITGGDESRAGSVLVDEKKVILVGKTWMDDFAGWLAWTLLKQRIQCGVNGLYPRAEGEDLSALFELQSY